MLRKIDWESQIGRRLRLRELHVFFTVAQQGSMAKAAAQLGVSAPTVSEVMADLEHGLGVKLLDRSPRGVEPTMYGRALLKRGLAAFDELKQGIKEIEFLTDPAAGTLSVGYTNMIAAVFAVIVERFAEKFPRVVMQLELVPSPVSKAMPGLRDRTFDLILARSSSQWLDDDHLMEEFDADLLFDDRMVMVAGAKSRFARRRKVDLAELVDEPWILSPPKGWSYELVAEAFKSRGLRVPSPAMMTNTMELRTRLLATGEFITVVPTSALNSDSHALKILPVELPARPWPITIFTLKNRTLSPVAEHFIACAREVAKSMVAT
jgi:DNA-binding transcriptional LysR family regulator